MQRPEEKDEGSLREMQQEIRKRGKGGYGIKRNMRRNEVENVVAKWEK